MASPGHCTDTGSVLPWTCMAGARGDRISATFHPSLRVRATVAVTIHSVRVGPRNQDPRRGKRSKRPRRPWLARQTRNALPSTAQLEATLCG